MSELVADHDLRTLLIGVRSVAIVGVSPRPDRPSNSVAAYLLAHTDWTISFINPTCDVVLGHRTLPSLAELEEPPDLVDVFRRPELLGGVTREAIDAGAGSVWYQLGLVDLAAAAAASAAGLSVVQNRCLRVEHERLIGLDLR